MLILAGVTSIGTDPEPTVLLVLDRLDEELADLISSRLRVSVLAEDDVAQFLFIPVVHRILLLVLFFRGLHVSGIGVQILLSSLALHIRIVTELALLSLFTIALLEEDTQNGLGVHTKGNLLHLHRLEQLGRLLLRLIGGLLLSLTTGLLGLFPLHISGFVRLLLGS